MTLVVDANVAIKWYITELDTPIALRLLSDEPDLIAPEHILAEVGQALWRRFRRGEITRTQVAEAVTRLSQSIELIPLEEIAAEAADIACEISYTVYDCLYIAAAVRSNTVLVTADDRLRTALSGSRWADRARLLSSI
jgi:predicted nucleic acid-binding protein